ncbi:hypothetical protein [Anthocerotibacter panamensis]|uniref:hypothetical protein n=1 Tax=Anthocerotibacter panamensis TaxID=2857077 RepID=UPI001C405B5F|nr:hypothetical protein [Anthocerotibacter panamensis]
MLPKLKEWLLLGTLLLTTTACGIPELVQARLRSAEETARLYLEAVKADDQLALQALSRPLELGDCSTTLTIDLNKALGGVLHQALPLTRYTLQPEQIQEPFAVVKAQLVRGSDVLSLKTDSAIVLEHSTGPWLVAGVVPADGDAIKILQDVVAQQARCKQP